MSDPQAGLRRRLRQLNPGQLRRVILALDHAVPSTILDRAICAVTDYETPKVEGQLELGD